MSDQGFQSIVSKGGQRRGALPFITIKGVSSYMNAAARNLIGSPEYIVVLASNDGRIRVRPAQNGELSLKLSRGSTFSSTRLVSIVIKGGYEIGEYPVELVDGAIELRLRKSK